MVRLPFSWRDRLPTGRPRPFRFATKKRHIAEFLTGWKSRTREKKLAGDADPSAKGGMDAGLIDPAVLGQRRRILS